MENSINVYKYTVELIIGGYIALTTRYFSWHPKLGTFVLLYPKLSRIMELQRADTREFQFS